MDSGLFVSRAATGLSKGYRIKFWNCPFNGDKYPAADGEKGVSDTTDEHDARLKRLELTELGKKVHLDTIAVIDSAHDTMEAGITDEERRICFEVLEKICKNVEKITGGE